jgi:hypothetical protein
MFGGPEVIERQGGQDPARSEPTVPQALGRLGERIQAIVDSAEAVAAEIHAEAEAGAARYLSDRRREADELLSDREQSLAEVTEAAVAQATKVKQELESLVEFFDTTIDGLRALAPGATDSSSTHLPADLKAVPEGDPVAGIPPEALLRITQMAITGSDRGELVRTLRDEFGISEAPAAIGQILSSPGLDRGQTLGRFSGPASADRPG